MMMVIHTENSTLVKKGRDKEKEYDQIQQSLDFITAKNMEIYTTYRIRSIEATSLTIHLTISLNARSLVIYCISII